MPYGIRYVLCTRYAFDASQKQEGFISYRIYRKVNISILPNGKNIELRSNISTKITTRKRVFISLIRVVLFYPVLLSGIAFNNFAYLHKAFYAFTNSFLSFFFALILFAISKGSDITNITIGKSIGKAH